jgi:hypothetical protein
VSAIQIIAYANDLALMARDKRGLREALQKLVKKNGKERPTTQSRQDQIHNKFKKKDRPHQRNKPRKLHIQKSRTF